MVKFIGTLKCDGESGKWSFETNAVKGYSLPMDSDLIVLLRAVADAVERGLREKMN
jgi:hypothetical protein